jgi:hypothetical protein
MATDRARGSGSGVTAGLLAGILILIPVRLATGRR